MSKARGINVPPDPNVFFQDYRDSTVTEYFLIQDDRDRRYLYLKDKGRSPTRFDSHYLAAFDSPEEPVKRYAIRWIEPRGGIEV